jgi:hypothetical protein
MDGCKGEVTTHNKGVSGPENESKEDGEGVVLPLEKAGEIGYGLANVGCLTEPDD